MFVVRHNVRDITLGSAVCAAVSLQKKIRNRIEMNICLSSAAAVE